MERLNIKSFHTFVQEIFFKEKSTWFLKILNFCIYNCYKKLNCKTFEITHSILRLHCVAMKLPLIYGDQSMNYLYRAFSFVVEMLYRFHSRY